MSDFQKARILVVEDEYYLADDLARALGQEGFEVLGPVGSIAEANSLLDEASIDCAVLDINLRGETAFNFIDRLATRGIPFMIASGYTGTAIPSRFSGAPRIEKPFQPQDVLAILPHILGKVSSGN